MRGASRDALADAAADLERRLSSSDVDAFAVGEQLFGVTHVLDDQVALRRALSDPAIAGERKAALVDAVFGGQLSEPARAVLHGVVTSRWSRMRDLADSLETLAVTAVLIAAEGSGEADDVEDELFRFGRIVQARPELRDALGSRSLPVANKTSLVAALLHGKATVGTRRLVEEIATHPRDRSPEDALAAYGEIAAHRLDRYVARVTTAVALSDDESQRLTAALAALYGHEIYLQPDVDPSLVGGVVVQVGDEILDGSIASRLAQARRQLD